MAMTIRNEPKAVKPFTGKKALLWFLGFFGVIFMMNGVMVYVALNTFPGLEVDSSYKVSQRYNKVIAQAAEQNVLAWDVGLQIERVDAQAAKVLVDARNKEGVPLTGEKVSVILKSPVTTTNDLTLSLSEIGEGRYTALIKDLRKGNWNVEVIISDPAMPGTPRFVSKNRIFLND